MEYILLIIIALSFLYGIVAKNRVVDDQEMIEDETMVEDYSNSTTVIRKVKYLSTTMIAKNNNVNRNHLFEYLLKEKYLVKSNGYIILEKAASLGARYETNDKNEKWIIWPDNSLNKIVKSLPKKQIQKNNSWPYRDDKTKKKSGNSYKPNVNKKYDFDENNADVYETYYQDEDSGGWR